MRNSMKQHIAPVALAAGLAIMAPSAASAQSLTGNVGSADITKGERAIESRFGLNDEGDAAARFQFEQAFTDWYQIRVIGAFARPDGGQWDINSVTIENWLQWRAEMPDGSGFNGGLRLAYTINDGPGPDAAAIRLTATDKFAERWEWRANAIAEFETGDGSEGGAALETRLQLARDVGFTALGTSDWKVGAELFSELGNTRDITSINAQAHQFGPIVKAAWSNGVYVQSGIRFGITDATDDAMFKFFIGRAF